MFDDISGFHDWFAGRRAENRYAVRTVALDAMPGWSMDGDSGAIRHDSGRFFTVAGVRVRAEHRAPGQWSQPIILQPEIGILGIVVKRFRGAFHCLMQAKMEPGNINLIQLSPTVQATRSNYMRVHRGSAVPYLEYFTESGSGRVVYDSLQSEQGSWFLDKRNRNMIVEVDDEVPLRDDFCWLRLDQLAELLSCSNLVNMDSRTVLAGLPFLDMGIRAPRQRTLNSVGQILSWFTDRKARHELDRTLVPLRDLPEWKWIDGRIERYDGRHFSVLGVGVEASNREVAQWSQPMLRPADRGVIAFAGRYFGDVFHILVNARTEAGTHDVVEMAPTVACIPASYQGDFRAERPRYLDLVERAHEYPVLVDVIHSEEGGRFYHAENRYLVIDVGEAIGSEVPPDYCWMTVPQLTGFVRYGNHVNVAARCLLSCMTEAVPEYEPFEVVR